MYVISRTIERDYFWVPDLPRDVHSQVWNELSSRTEYLEKFQLAVRGNEMYVLSQRMPTSREDHVHRIITNNALLVTKNIEMALKVYAAREALLPWSEAFFQSNGTSGWSNLAQKIATASIIVPLEKWQRRQKDNLIIYSLEVPRS